jgi:hypothetical protein
MFLPFLSEYAIGRKEQLALDAARKSLDFNALFRKGIADAQEKIPA